MSELGQRVSKYQVTAIFRENAVCWQLAIETEGRTRFEILNVDGAEIPIVLDLMRHDQSVFYDPQARRLSTGWNDPGKK